ncbi:MAG TPA: thiamine pyrophosphate-dependent enzyme [Sphingobacterium sp.]|nr:thiamine pyrophosphate-dependent enzyme [Sphingobacterium sp.]
MDLSEELEDTQLSFDDFRTLVLKDYKAAVQSRYVSLLGRREVFTGKAKFGIFGDGKELPQIALAKVFKEGDWRSGYYRDQTLGFETGMTTVYQFFSQLYAHPDPEADPSSSGRQMISHIATPLLDSNGEWMDQTAQKNSFADVSTTGGQMARAVGLGLASKIYRNTKELAHLQHFSKEGNEVVFCTIGNASTSEGVFWEAINAIGVKQIPLVVSIWDDGYGISVPNDIQTTKGSISEVLSGFQKEGNQNGFEIFKVKGWDYAGLCETYEYASKIAREKHIPVLIHVYELTQPQGHSTSGSHERYKSTDRLQWEKEHDCIAKMEEWMIETGITTEGELKRIKKEANQYVKSEQKRAWSDYNKMIKVDLSEAIELLSAFNDPRVEIPLKTLKSLNDLSLLEVYANVRRVFRELRGDLQDTEAWQNLRNWYEEKKKVNKDRFNDYVFTQTPYAVTHVEEVKPVYNEETETVDGREVLNACFKAHFETDERLYAFGEDVGKIGDVNQGFAGLQELFGADRIADTGIREAVIIGKGIGMAARGLRPIAEIQYLDYLIYALPTISDDLASLSYRTKGKQKAPLVIRTRGHRLEGIWHSGSPMSVLLGALRGIHICVPRNMTQAAGMYNTLLRSDEPALVIECLNGYRLKEKLPENIKDFTVPIGIAEKIREGRDITVVSYGSTLRIVQEAALELEKFDISLEIIDAQCLTPFDRTNICIESLSKTNKLLVVDEDMPGGASAYIQKHILEEQKGYYVLDGQPRTLSAKENRPPYGSDGDYFTKPSVDDVVELAYEMMGETFPDKYPSLF